MKVNDLRHQLDEGFLDNLISKVKSMAGGDGPTGVIRALQGNNAALNKFADAIVNTARPRINQRLGNARNAIESGTGRMPIQTIYNQTMAVTPGIAERDGIRVEPAGVKQVIKNNRSELLRMVLNGDAAEDDVVRNTYNAVMSGSPEADLGNNIDGVTKTVALIIASAVIFIQTSQEDAEATGDKVDANLVDEFNKTGNKITVALATADSPVVRELKANEVYKDKVEALIVNIARTIRERYLNVDASTMSGLVTSPPSLVSLNAVKNAISSHASGIDPDKANTFAQRLQSAIQQLFTQWLTIADNESTPGRPQSLEVLRHWAADLLNNYLDNLDTSASPEVPAPAPADPAEVEITNVEDQAHEAGLTARRALTRNPGEADADFATRQYSEYLRAFNDYMTTHRP
jgi:hypothetical protein